MANVNLFELEECLEGLVPFVSNHPDKDYVRTHGAHVTTVLAELRAALAETDQHYYDWRMGDGGGQTSLKKLHLAFKAAQRQLAAVGAIGYPDEAVDYLDDANMRELGLAMVAWLQDHAGVIEGADELIASLKNHLERSRKGLAEGTQAREDYQRTVSKRIRAIEQAEDVVRTMRLNMRVDLGPRDKTYTAIPWPAALAPDPC